MGKLKIYILVMSGLMLLFYFTGLIEHTPHSTLLTLLLNPEGLAATTFEDEIKLAVEGVAILAVITIGIIISNLELAVVGGFAIYLFGLLWDFSYVVAKVYSTNPVFAMLLFSPVLLLYMVTILEWWRGRDV